MTNPGSLQAQTEQQKSKIIFWGYLSGAGLCLLALVLLSIGLGQALRTTTRGLHQFKFPGEATFSLKQPGMYLAIVQQSGEEPLPVHDLARMNFDLTGKESGLYVPIDRPPAPQPLQMGGQFGYLLFQSEVPSAGDYVFRSAYLDGAGSSGEGLLVHESIGHNRADVAVSAILFLVIGGCGVIVLWRTRKAAAENVLAASAGGKKKK